MQTLRSLHEQHLVRDHQQMVDESKDRRRRALVTPVAERFFKVLKMLDIQRKDFAKLPGVTHQNLAIALKRGSIGKAHMERLRELAAKKGLEGLTIDWLESGEGNPPKPSERKIGNLSAIQGPADELPVLVAPGTSSEYMRFQYLAGYAQEHSPFVDIPYSLLRSNADLLSPSVRIYPMPNDSMRGEIEQGDFVFVDTSVDRIEVDGTYAYKIWGKPQVRRVQVRGKDKLRFRGTREFEDSHELSGKELEDLEIGGRVVGSIGCKKF
jgi:phage repressor protein C with HTH and peptisase S24 domain